MNALTVRPWWGLMIAAGIKDVENRNWRARWPQRILIHASGRCEVAGYVDFLKFTKDMDLPWRPTMEECIAASGRFLCAVTVSGMEKGKICKSAWRDGESAWCWRLKGPVAFHQCWTATGALGLWPVEQNDLARAMGEIGQAALGGGGAFGK